MIIHHSDADGIAAAGLLILSRKFEGIGSFDEELKALRYATVGYINKFLRKISGNQPEPLFLVDINADDGQEFSYRLQQLAKKGFKITLLDHHPYSRDEELKASKIEVIRDTEVCAAELVYRTCIADIPAQYHNKANFLLLLGALGDRKITPFVENIMKKMRQETIFDVHAVQMAGTYNDSFLRSLFYEREKDGIGFTKKLYEKAVDKRFFLEKVKKQVLKNHTWIKGVRARVVHIYSPYIGLAAGYLIDQDCDFAIAIGDGKPPLRMMIKDYIKKIFSLGLSKDFRIWQGKRNIRISFRTKKPVNEIVESIARSCGGTGGGHKYACGANVPTESLEPFLRQLLIELQKL